MNKKIRVDKYTWAVRLFKTRSIAANACKQKKILINELPVKPSRTLKVGDIFKIKHPPEYRLYKVEQMLSNRVGAKLVHEYLKEITPKEILETLEKMKTKNKIIREHGAGRPTKKDRRDLRKYFG